MTATLTPSATSRFRAGARRRRWRGRWPLLAVLVLVGLLGGGGYVLLGTQFAAVQRIRVTGTSAVAASAVLQAAHVRLGTAMIMVDRAGVRKRILSAQPGIAAVSVRLSWPSTLHLVVRERVPVAVVPNAGRYTLLDRMGVAYRDVSKVPAGLVVIDVQGPGPAAAATRAALLVLTGLPADLRALVQRVNAPTAAQVTLILRGNRQVRWGDPSDGAVKARVTRVLLARPGRVVDVTAPGLVTVR